MIKYIFGFLSIGSEKKRAATPVEFTCAYNANTFCMSHMCIKFVSLMTLGNLFYLLFFIST